LNLETSFNVDVVAGGASFYVTLLPSVLTYSSLSGASISQLAEQRGASQMLCVGATDASSLTISGRYKPWELFGLKKQFYENDPQYANFPSSDPAQLGFIHMIITPTGSTAMLSFARVVVNTGFKFAGINVMSSAQPTLAAKSGGINNNNNNNADTSDVLTDVVVIRKSQSKK